MPQLDNSSTTETRYITTELNITDVIQENRAKQNLRNNGVRDTF